MDVGVGADLPLGWRNHLHDPRLHPVLIDLVAELLEAAKLIHSLYLRIAYVSIGSLQSIGASQELVLHARRAMLRDVGSGVTYRLKYWNLPSIKVVIRLNVTNVIFIVEIDVRQIGR